MSCFTMKSCMKQRAKAHWLTEGDTNSKFFHAAESRRKKRNHIHHLINNGGKVVENQSEMELLDVEYFKGIFAGSNSVVTQEVDHEERVITSSQNEKLTADITYEEFTRAVKPMHPDKSAGPDRFSPAFFQQFWDILGKDIFNSCSNWLKESKFPATLNDSTLVLIPKNDNVERMAYLWPITLCNVLYKIVAKVLANRLKEILSGVITENQSAFVLERNISDNVLVAFQLLHFMRNKNIGQVREIALKLDISKAYDRVD